MGGGRGGGGSGTEEPTSMGSLHLFSSTMKCLLSAVLVVTFANLSLHFYSPPIQRAAPPPEPVCKQVPKEVCNQVPKTTYESVTKNENVKSHRGLSKRLFLVSSVDFSSEKTAKLLRTQGSNVTQFKMRSVRMFHRNNVVLSMIGSAQGFPNRNAGMWPAVNVTLSTARNAKLSMARNVIP